MKDIVEPVKKPRNSYIDIIKLVFSIMIVLFHFGEGIAPSGRIAVEGFFMISGYLMMVKISQNDRVPKNRYTGFQTIEFIIHKLKSLLVYLVPSFMLTIVVDTLYYNKPILDVLKALPLYFFDVFPLNALGYRGNYIIGISWYLSSMFFSLAVLFPICVKYKEKFILKVGIPIALLIYGYLSCSIGTLAVPVWYETLGKVQIPMGLLRGIAGCTLGCVVFVIVEEIQRRKIEKTIRRKSLLLEMGGGAYFLYIVSCYPASRYDYLMIFVLFGLLIIGISGITGLQHWYSFTWTRQLNICSIILVLNHYHWGQILSSKYGENKGDHFLEYCLYVLCSSAIVYLSVWIYKRIQDKKRNRKTMIE